MKIADEVLPQAMEGELLGEPKGSPQFAQALVFVVPWKREVL